MWPDRSDGNAESERETGKVVAEWLTSQVDFRSGRAGIRQWHSCVCVAECRAGLHLVIQWQRTSGPAVSHRLTTQWNFPPLRWLRPGADGRSESLSRTQEGEWEEGWEEGLTGRETEPWSGQKSRNASLQFRTNSFHHRHHNRGLSRVFKWGKKSYRTTRLSLCPPFSPAFFSVFCKQLSVYSSLYCSCFTPRPPVSCLWDRFVSSFSVPWSSQRHSRMCSLPRACNGSRACRRQGCHVYLNSSRI